jgi:hypothetical protein
VGMSTRSGPTLLANSGPGRARAAHAGHTPALSHPHELVDRLEAYAAEQGLVGGH